MPLLLHASYLLRLDARVAPGSGRRRDAPGMVTYPVAGSRTNPATLSPRRPDCVSCKAKQEGDLMTQRAGIGAWGMALPTLLAALIAHGSAHAAPGSQLPS